jgi:hypothetical protein
MFSSGKVYQEGLDQTRLDINSLKQLFVLRKEYEITDQQTKTGDYLIIKPVEENIKGPSKILAMVEHILRPPQIKHLKKLGIW